MKRVTGAGLALAATITLAACGAPAQVEGVANGPTLPPTSSATATPTPTPTGPPRSPRGNIIKALGEEGGLTDDRGAGAPVELVTFAVDAISPVECTEDYGNPPENGVLIAVQMRFATAPELATSSMNYFSVNPNEFSFVGADGITVTNTATAATFGCISDKEMLTYNQMMPGSQYVGKVVLDVPAATGTLIYRPGVLAEGGWEWTF